MTGPRNPRPPAEPERSATPRPEAPDVATSDDLDLDLEETGDGERLKEGFTGQER